MFCFVEIHVKIAGTNQSNLSQRLNAKVSAKFCNIHSIAENFTQLFSGHLQPQSADCYQYQYDSGSEINWGSKGIVAQLVCHL